MGVLFRYSRHRSLAPLATLQTPPVGERVYCCRPQTPLVRERVYCYTHLFSVEVFEIVVAWPLVGKAWSAHTLHAMMCASCWTEASTVSACMHHAKCVERYHRSHFGSRYKCVER